MKNFNYFIISVLLMCLFASCSSSYFYTSRQVKINKKDLNSKNQYVAIQVDYTQTVSATSDYVSSKSEAMSQAEYSCLNKHQADVLVDPIYSFEYNKYKKKWKVTVMAFVGRYETAVEGVEAMKNIDIVDIEKYKLLTDPNFLQYYYSNGAVSTTGDTYFINTSKESQTKRTSVVMKSPDNNQNKQGKQKKEKKQKKQRKQRRKSKFFENVF